MRKTVKTHMITRIAEVAGSTEQEPTTLTLMARKVTTKLEPKG